MTEPTAVPNMRRDFTDRADLIAYLKQEFPAAAQIDAHVSPIRGGHAASAALLGAIHPARYAASRNFLSGAVTKLSPYLRHGVVTLALVHRTALARVRAAGEAEKLITELAWRDYWQRLYAQLGDGIWQDREPYKTGFAASDYAAALPSDVHDGVTGLPCIDAFVAELHTTGYIHNHARMWLAAYVVHWRRTQWQAGARWFLTHLLDGDPASNNLSWQWVASTFSHKPYMFNRENLERYTDGMYCRTCPLRGRCDFEGTYEDLQAKLFPLRPPETPTPNSGSWHRGAKPGRRR